MTQEEAKDALELGRKVRHKWFMPDEYIIYRNGEVYDEAGWVLPNFWMNRTSYSWQTGWTIVKRANRKRKHNFFR